MNAWMTFHKIQRIKNKNKNQKIKRIVYVTII
jgi:hypothetical protein